ncbi:MAG: hypothetical protein J6A77_08905 [Lachnospiraceae bacterium]|nr:hypothetical protein [Lachnospiraceae bacterium]
MSETEKTKKKKVKKIVRFLLGFSLMLGIGFCVGMLAGKLFKSELKPIVNSMSLGEFIFCVCGFYLWFWFSTLVQVVVHEAGHLVFGLLSGYKFSSFRIGSFMWVKLNEKIRFKRYSLAGTGGQCLMAPPDLVDGKIPYVLYNMGGSMANVIVSIVPFVMALVTWKWDILHGMLLLWGISGLSQAAMNGIPLKIQGNNNDGYNVKELGKNPESIRALWLQMKMNELETYGQTSKDMPEEWFAMPSEEGLQNSMIASIAVFRCFRMIDEKKFAEADELMEQLLDKKTGMVDVHRKMLINEQIYCEIVGEQRAERFEKLMTEDQEKFMKSMKTSPSVFRTEYLYAKYVEKDEKRAERALKDFERVSEKYPYPQEIKGEREMIAYAEEKCQK